MSIITQFSVYSHCNDLGGKVWNPAIRWTKKYAVFVVLENDQGVSGLGECWCFDSAPDTLIAFLRTELAPHVIGMQTDAMPELRKTLTSRATLTARHGILASALSAVDIACWDIRSREASQPLWTYLQSQIDDFELADGQVQLYASGGLYGKDKHIEDLVSEMVHMSQSGFTTVKMKVGGLSIADDIARVTAVLDGLDTTCKLIIDGVYSYTAEQAMKIYSALPKERIEAFQSPVKASDISAMHALTDAGIPVMGTEAEYREELHQQLIDQPAIRFLQTAPIACGGISRLVELGEMIKTDGHNKLKLSLEVSSTAIALMAACHFAAVSRQTAHAEYHFVHTVFFDELPLQRMTAQPGWFKLPDTHGLGITLPNSQVKLECQIA